MCQQDLVADPEACLRSFSGLILVDTVPLVSIQDGERKKIPIERNFFDGRFDAKAEDVWEIFAFSVDVSWFGGDPG